MAYDRRARTEQLLAGLESAKEKGGKLSREEFWPLFDEVVLLKIETPEELAARFMVCVGTIYRWQGDSAPSPLARRVVIASLVELVRESLRQ